MASFHPTRRQKQRTDRSSIGLASKLAAESGPQTLTNTVQEERERGQFPLQKFTMRQANFEGARIEIDKTLPTKILNHGSTGSVLWPTSKGKEKHLAAQTDARRGERNKR
jgi:hypothetical protein